MVKPFAYAPVYTQVQLTNSIITEFSNAGAYSIVYQDIR